MILPSSSGRTRGIQAAAARTPAAPGETNPAQAETGAPSGRFGDWASDSEIGRDQTSVPRDEQNAEQILDYPRLPNQQNPAMYFVPGIAIAISGFVMFAYTLLALISQRPGIAVFTTAVIPPSATVGDAATSVINIVFMVLDTVMTLGAITMTMRKNLTLSRAGRRIGNHSLCRARRHAVRNLGLRRVVHPAGRARFFVKASRVFRESQQGFS